MTGTLLFKTLFFLSMEGGFPSGKESACQCRRHRFDSWSGKIPHAEGQLNLFTTTTEPVPRAQELQLPKPMHPRACTLQQEKPPQ